jgi:FMN hydrolase / 5-amino-6-(5-phospho-D-ribitylamino)uracil phosphatase
MRLSDVAAISFDLDDTLWSFRASVEQAEKKLHSWLMQHAPKTERVLPEWEALGRLRQDYERSRPELSTDYRALRLGSIELALALAKEDVDLAAMAYEVFYLARQKVVFYEDVWPALTWLSGRFPLVAVTNGNADLQRTGGAEFFTTTLSAAALRIAKPDSAIFHAAAASVNVKPEEMLHVGDDFRLDVMGALDAGLKAVWLVRDDRPGVDRREINSNVRYLQVRDLSVVCRALGGPDAGLSFN